MLPKQACRCAHYYYCYYMLFHGGWIWLAKAPIKSLPHFCEMMERPEANWAYSPNTLPRMSPFKSLSPTPDVIVDKFATLQTLPPRPPTCTPRVNHIMYLHGTHLGRQSKHRSCNVKGIWIMAVMELVSQKLVRYESHHRNLNSKGVGTSTRRPSQLDFSLPQRECLKAHTFHGLPRVFKEAPEPFEFNIVTFHLWIAARSPRSSFTYPLHSYLRSIHLSLYIESILTPWCPLRSPLSCSCSCWPPQWSPTARSRVRTNARCLSRSTASTSPWVSRWTLNSSWMFPSTSSWKCWTWPGN